ncbi:2-hydroxyacid dehydrogenase [Diaphorobacter caeni]|nr:2-hydroxyacid dehydrogenase [Diaphorobacter caeni]
MSQQSVKVQPPLRVAQMISIGEHADTQLRERHGAISLWDKDAAFIDAHAAEVELLVTTARIGCSAETIARFPRLRGISSWGAGFDTIDVAAARARGIPVSNTPGVLDGCVADMAWALLLASARRVAEGDQYVRDGKWVRLGEFPVGLRVSGKRLGIVGMGNIGQAIARRGVGFDMEVRYTGRSAKPDLPHTFMPELTELAAWADFLVLACVGGASTFHIVNADVLKALGPQGIVVNIARGTVIDQAALIDALVHRTIGGAGLDVLEGEPGAPEIMRQLPNVVFTPHMASATTDTRLDMQRCVVANVEQFLRTGSMLTPI